MISTSYPVDDNDWQGRFIADMATALSRKQISLDIWAPPGKLPDRVNGASSSEDNRWLSKLVSNGGIAHLLRTNPVKGTIAALSLLHRLSHSIKDQQCDLIHVNWLQNSLALGAHNTPALITVLGSDFGLLKLPAMRLMLRRAIKRRKCIISPNAEWMAPELHRQFGDIAEIRPIPFGIHQRFFAVSRAFKHPPMWIAVTRITRGKIGKLFDWGQHYFGSQRALHLFGPMQEDIVLPSWVTWHGPITPNDLTHSWLPYAAGLITLSSHDEGRPQAILDAMAAGLPIIASDLPAHRDLIRHSQTGWLVSSASELEEAFSQLENPMVNASVGNAARKYVLDNVGTWDDCATRYLEAYRDLLNQK